MAYSILDTRGFLSDGPSIAGMSALKKCVQDQVGISFPALEQLLEYGYTNRLLQLSIDCRNLEKRAADSSVKSSLHTLAASARKAHEILMLEG